MAKSGRQQPLGEISFSCPRCTVEKGAYTFRAAPGRTEDDPDQAHHPWRYFGKCPSCQQECEQAPWERALLKAWASATGPRTPEGKAATAENLKGHPTEEEARRTRFNAMKHGLNARVATYFPAKPDGYAFCAGCEVDREWCGKQAACVKRTETFMLHHAAFEQRKPEILREMHGDMHAAIFSIIQQLLQSIMAEGVRLKAPVWFSDKDGGLHFVKTAGDPDDPTISAEDGQVYDLSANPLLKPLTELLKATGLSLSDLGQTVRVMDAAEEEEMGRLRSGTPKAGVESLEDFQRRVTGVMEGMRDVVSRAHTRTEQDAVLLEYNRESGVHEPVKPAAAGGKA